ncbi:AAA family ATPase [Enterococcus gallinarum]|uniref:ATP-dependent nuclease n=1 Tax=Enterococcus TaxID=1350 RepID=UPI00288D9B0A|nr:MULTISPECIES: AAA family ATPase [Enterococcus]MDT2425352.1 AAA family ATPase [Enterococcus avium]MDT2724698.1 AAA family ATPase [Enterococcus gallinarum]
MILSKLFVENFRNYKSTEIKLSNKNVVFGMNDVGKTNLLWSLRYLLDRKVRSNGFSESDYYQRDISNKIKITLEVKLSDFSNSRDSQHIVSKVAGARSSEELSLFYFQVIGDYDSSEAIGIPVLYWGNNLSNLERIPQTGSFSVLDRLFNVIYVDPTIDLDTIFSKNKKKIFEQKKMIEDDIEKKKEIDELTILMNERISSMQMVQKFQESLTEEYKQLKKEKISIALQSEMAIKGFFSDIHPYIKKEGDDALYPTSGDGRKKILAYSLLNFLKKEYDSDRITIYLIEEPENSLHRSMQIALSKQLFDYSVYDYFFLSTHSSELLYEMDDASLIRIYSEDKTTTESFIYNVPEEFVSVKKELNESLTTALFADRVLLIEGPSEKALFEKVLSVVRSTYELEGGYLLLVDGIKFKPYYDILKKLSIIPIVKTDNDLKEKKGNVSHFDIIGFNRCYKLLNMDGLDSIIIDYSTIGEDGKEIWYISEKEKKVLEEKKQLFLHYKQDIKMFNDENIFISKIDLENDLFEVIPERLNEVFGSNNPIKRMQDKKLLNMLKLIDNLTEEDCFKIFNHERFESLKRVVIS